MDLLCRRVPSLPLRLQAGTYTNTQEGLWYHVKRTIVGTRNLEMSLIDFMFR